MDERKRVAHCCCGSLRVETTGEPLSVQACFCEECQRRSGSAFGLSTYWSKDDARVSGPATRYERNGQDGRKVILYFCPSCGTTVYWEVPERRPNDIGVAGGTFFDPGTRAPEMSVWERSKYDWLAIPAQSHFNMNPIPPTPLPKVTDP